MALEDEDRQEIARMIAEGNKAPQRPRTGTENAAFARSERPSQTQWDQMNDRDQTAYIRSTVEDYLAEQDKEIERQNLKAENEAMRAELDEWKKGGKRGPKPKPHTDDKREEQAPTVVSKAAAWLFGQPSANP